MNFHFLQFITFRNGNFGVRFGGYHAEAGLGGLLNGGGGHGGLFASAGTPFGQRASAGLGGVLSGQGPLGGLYAGAQNHGQIANAGGGGFVHPNAIGGFLGSFARNYGYY